MMHHFPILALSIASAHALSPNAKNPKREFSEDDNLDLADTLCQPKNATGSPDFSAPCNVVIALQTQCMYGPQAAAYVSLPEDDPAWDDAGDWTEQSPETQRDCMCSSRVFEQFSGCQKCYEVHDSNFFQYAPSFVGKEKDFAEYVREKYCAVDSTPKLGWGEFVYSVAMAASATGSASSGSATSTATMDSDATATETDVSLYFTGSVPGSSAWSLAQPTPTGSSGNVTYTSLNNESGMIQPTGTASGGDGDSGENGGNEESATSSASDAEQTGSSSDESAAVRVSLVNGLMAIGAVGFAAVVCGL